MNFIKLFLVFLIFTIPALASSNKKPFIAVSINPIYEIALSITQDKNNTVLLIKPHFSEHNYQFKKTEISNISKADLVFYIDDNSEKNLAKFVNNPIYKNKFFQLSKISNIKLLRRKDNDKEIDYHLWLNPDNAILIAEFIAKKISEIDKINSSKYQNNLLKFKKEILQNNKNIKHKLSQIKEPKYVFYYDVYQYFEEYFNISSFSSISSNHDSELKFNDFKNFNEAIKNRKINCVISDVWDEKNSALKLAKSNNVKFFKASALGIEDDARGYIDILTNIAENISNCHL